MTWKDAPLPRWRLYIFIPIVVTGLLILSLSVNVAGIIIVMGVFSAVINFISPRLFQVTDTYITFGYTSKHLTTLPFDEVASVQISRPSQQPLGYPYQMSLRHRGGHALGSTNTVLLVDKKRMVEHFEKVGFTCTSSKFGIEEYKRKK